MSVIEHLEALRRALIISLIAWGAAAGAPIHPPACDRNRPLRRAWCGGRCLRAASLPQRLEQVRAPRRHVSARSEPVHQLRAADGDRLWNRLRAAGRSLRAGDAADHELRMAAQAAAILLLGARVARQLSDARRRPT